MTFEYRGIRFEVSNETYNKFLAYLKAEERLEKAFNLSRNDFKWSEIRFEIDNSLMEVEKARQSLIA